MNSHRRHTRPKREATPAISSIMWGDLSIGNNKSKPLKATPKVYVQYSNQTIGISEPKGSAAEVVFCRRFDYRGFSETKILVDAVDW